jgi:hypothetical protein
MTFKSEQNDIDHDLMNLVKAYGEDKIDDTDRLAMLVSAFGELQMFCQSTQGKPAYAELRGLAISAQLLTDHAIDMFDALSFLKNDKTDSN